MFRQLQDVLTIVQLYSKGGLVEKTIMYNSVHTAKFEISLPVTLHVFTFKELSISVFESLGVR